MGKIARGRCATTLRRRFCPPYAFADRIVCNPALGGERMQFDPLRRRAFIALIGAWAAAYPAAARGQQSGRYVRALQAAKRDYEKMSKPSEAARSDYITRLVRMREEAARLKTDEWQAIDAEIKRHPAPDDSDSKKLSSLLVGEWKSPRHDYLFRPDGTWTMLPVEEGITHGRWRIEGNNYLDTAATDPSETSRYISILITRKDFVFADQTYVFSETRFK